MAVTKTAVVEEEARDIKEINEILDALEVTLSTAGEVLADGKIDFSDIPAALKLVNNYSKFMDAVENASEAIDEIKDIDQAEALAIGMRLFNIVKGVLEVIKTARK